MSSSLFPKPIDKKDDTFYFKAQGSLELGSYADLIKRRDDILDSILPNVKLVDSTQPPTRAILTTYLKKLADKMDLSKYSYMEYIQSLHIMKQSTSKIHELLRLCYLLPDEIPETFEYDTKLDGQTIVKYKNAIEASNVQLTEAVKKILDFFEKNNPDVFMEELSTLPACILEPCLAYIPYYNIYAGNDSNAKPKDKENIGIMTITNKIREARAKKMGYVPDSEFPTINVEDSPSFSIKKLTDLDKKNNKIDGIKHLLYFCVLLFHRVTIQKVLQGSANDYSWLALNPFSVDQDKNDEKKKHMYNVVKRRSLEYLLPWYTVLNIEYLVVLSKINFSDEDISNVTQPTEQFFAFYNSVSKIYSKYTLTNNKMAYPDEETEDTKTEMKDWLVNFNNGCTKLKDGFGTTSVVSQFSYDFLQNQKDLKELHELLWTDGFNLPKSDEPNVLEIKQNIQATYWKMFHLLLYYIGTSFFTSACLCFQEVFSVEEN